MSLDYVCTGFENASPANWSIQDDGSVLLELIYDRERCSPNRAVLHWHVQLQGTPGTEITVILKHFDNIWNGRAGSPLREQTSCCISEDGRQWRVIVGRKRADNTLEVRLRLAGPRLYFSRIEPYRISDLARFLGRIEGDSRVQVTPLGQTVEGRSLELLRVGDPSLHHAVLLRARAHPWESGGNWVVEGLVERLLSLGPGTSAPTYCLYVLPMANKDGVARGGSRFNAMGMDLNRLWDRPADRELAPENAVLEDRLAEMQAAGCVPSLAIDLHNDGGGKLHLSRPEHDADSYLAKMACLEQVLREYTWFTEGSTGAGFHNPGSFGEGLYQRFGIPACILELNCNWSAGLNKAPLGADWRFFGGQLHDALEAYCRTCGPLTPQPTRRGAV